MPVDSVARGMAAQALNEIAGSGVVTNLGISEDASTVSLTSSTGTGVTIPAATDSVAGVLDAARATKIDGLAAVATSGSYADLSSKPALGTAAGKDIPATGNASATQVIYGSDTRLSDSRTPTAHASSHGTGQSDAITIAPAQVSGTAVVTTDSRLSGLGGADSTHDANYTLLPADAGKGLFHSSASAHAWSIDTNANQAIPVGSVIVFTTGQSSGVVTLTPLSGVTFERCDGTTGTGARTMGPAMTATARQRATDTWVLSGVFAS